jgi:hypothetical protein
VRNMQPDIFQKLSEGGGGGRWAEHSIESSKVPFLMAVTG